MPNRLAGETSPYLLQHKDNPVDWFPWGPEALEKAKQEDRPIFLSIGYSACHWCHVMEHESFEDPQTAEVMNALFVSIKVDREERPDLDSIYMQAVQTLTGRGGWPMSVFLTPAGQPFYGGTYYPPDDRHGMPSFTKVLMAVADAYQNKRSDVTDTAGQLTSRLQPAAVQGTEMLTVDLLQQACQSAKAQFEPAHGGFGSAPKFPQPMTLEFLLRCWARFGDSEALRMATFTMQKMARGGMYDQVGGGFHRYSTDAFWLVPHFEKMLYDNALLSRVYVQAAQATGEPFYRRIAEETFDYVLKEMTHPSGAFYSTQDADSEGHEGKFFVWTPVQTAALLGEDDARVVNHYYGATEAGNFEGRNIFHVPSDASKAAADLGMPEQAVLAIVERARARLYAAREERVHPGLDDKVLTSWNGLMLRSLAEGAAALGRDDYLQAAVKNAAFLLQHHAPGRALAPDVQRWDGEADGLPRGLRHAGRRAGLAVRGHLRKAMARRGSLAGRRYGLALLGPGGRPLLRHRVRPRIVDRPAEGHVRQRNAQRRIGRGRRVAAPGGAHRRERIQPEGRLDPSLSDAAGIAVCPRVRQLAGGARFLSLYAQGDSHHRSER